MHYEVTNSAVCDFFSFLFFLGWGVGGECIKVYEQILSTHKKSYSVSHASLI